MLSENPTTILFITGAFVTHKCWDEWQLFFENKGYETHAPAWPYKDAPAAVLRERHPDPQIADLRLAELILHFASFVQTLPQKPIVIGHSIGGLIAQILLQRNLVSSAVAIHSVPPQGIMTFKFSFLKAGWGPLGFFTSSKNTFLMSFSQWQYAFTNGMPEEWQEKAYYTSVIPESKLIVRDTITSVAKVDFTAQHRPLLFIAGTTDHTIPESLNYSNYKKYSNPNSITDYKVFKDRNHYVLNQPGWQEIAVYIQDWLTRLPSKSI